MKAKPSDSGMALVIVLWMMALLMIMALAYSHTTRTNTVITANFVQSAKARALAEAGIWLAVDDLLQPDDKRLWSLDNLPRHIQFADEKMTVAIQDELGRIDLNTATPELLKGLLQAVEPEGEEQTRTVLVDAILDWRDPDKLVRLHGAEDHEYQAEGRPYGAKDGAFNALDELLLVRGMTPALYQKMRPAVTIYAVHPGIKPEVAPRTALLALPGMDGAAADQLLSARSSRKTSPAPLTEINPRYVSRVRGNTFSITSIGNNADARYVLEVVVLIQQNTRTPYSILAWSENHQTISEAETTGNE